MSKLIDLTGQRFGSLIAVGLTSPDATGKTQWTCACDCGSLTVATALNLKSGNTKSCGCKKHKSGLDNPRTVSDPTRLLETKTLALNTAWRQDVINRDGACKKCGSESDLQAHHIVSRRDDPSRIVDPDNGMTLCADCHMAFHVKYGRRGGFSGADLREFVS